MNETSHEKLAELIKDIHIAMMVTSDANGEMHSRPMVTMAFEENQKFEGTLWFFAKKDSFKVHDIEKVKNVVVNYSDPSKQRYVAVYGLASVETNKFNMLTLWKDDLKTWFPKGLEDPDLVLIKVEISTAEMWDSPPGKMIKLKEIAKSILTGNHYQTPKPGSRQIGTKIQ